MIATPAQLAALEPRLGARGVDLARARELQMYFSCDADEALQKFMIRDWPDESLLNHFIHRLVARAGGRPIRVFSGMQALLVARGHTTSVLRLEQLWHRLCDNHELVLFCAYPRAEFPEDMESVMRALCSTHSRIVA